MIRMRAGADPRRCPARPDLAAAHLKGEVEAGRYAEATAMTVSVPLAPQTARPDSDAPMSNQLLYGEGFAAYELGRDWAWGQAGLDGYVGYVPRACLSPAGPAASHRITQLLTHVYAKPALKTRPIGWLSYGAQIGVEGSEAGFATLSAGGFVPAQHVARRDALAGDWVGEAERFMGAPYLWGGRAATGLDCSALVQLALHAAGHDCPRDSDMQQAELGAGLAEDARLERGDLIFWKGHVGIMLDDARLLHTNAGYMATTIEVLDTARARILAAGDGPVTGRVRLDAGGGRG